MVAICTKICSILKCYILPTDNVYFFRTIRAVNILVSPLDLVRFIFTVEGFCTVCTKK
jgi:hypothetical protein